MEYLLPFLLSYVLLLFGATWVYAHSTLQNIHMHQDQPTKSFIHLVGARKGDSAPGIGDVKSYLHRFGYLNDLEYSNDNVNKDLFDESLERALLTYKDFYKLNKTGVLDHETVSLMSRPRCGNPDIHNGNAKKTKYISGKFSRHYRLFPGRPHRTGDDLYVAYKESVPPQIDDGITQAFLDWQPYVPLKFWRTLEPGGAVPDIRVEFFRREHGDGQPFDGPGGAIAHATKGSGSIMHFDAEENWQVGAVPGSMDVASVARHEIGHLLGLDHSDIQSAVMYPYIDRGTVRMISDDDKAGIRDLYYTK